MKITTRIVTGYGLFIAALVGLAVYQIVTVHQMQSINENLKEINFENAFVCFQAIRDRDVIDEYAEKLLITGDSDIYYEGLKDGLEFFDASLNELESGFSSEEERREIERLRQFWEAFIFDLRGYLEELPEEGLEQFPPVLENDLDVLRNQILSVYEALEASIDTRVDQATKTSDTAQIVLVSVTGVVLAVTILVALLIVRSISKPLGHLTEGTRAITEGKYYYRLDTSRRDEFAQLAKDFNSMIRRLSELDEMKQDFISHVSHELKSPLASMRETVQLMIDEIPGPLTEKQKRLLELNLQSGDRLTSMIRNLLDLSKIEAGTVEYVLKSQDLVPLVKTAVDVFEVQAAERKIRIERSLPDAPLLVKCDSDRIVQVILNLMGNAVKFSPDGASIHVRLEPVSEIPETLPRGWRSGVAVPETSESFGLLSITDSGPGIPDTDKFRVFEKFHQVHKGKKVAAGQGVGLGLAICRTIVQTHHGAIWVEDNPGGGSRFFLLLSPGIEEEEIAVRASHPI